MSVFDERKIATFSLQILVLSFHKVLMTMSKDLRIMLQEIYHVQFTSVATYVLSKLLPLSFFIAFWQSLFCKHIFC